MSLLGKLGEALAAKRAEALDYKAIVESGKIDGVKCPCCGGMVKVYRRSISKTMALQLVALVRMYSASGDWVHHSTIPGQGSSREISKLRYWGLVEEADGKSDKSKRTGFWRPTKVGIGFARGNGTVSKVVLVFQGKVVGEDGPQVSIGRIMSGKASG